MLARAAVGEAQWIGTASQSSVATAEEGDSALKQLHALANAPIFSLFDSFFGGGG